MKTNQSLSVLVASMLIGACSPAPEQSSTDQVSQTGVAQSSTPPAIYQDYLNRDVRDDIFYFVLPDRFNNANPDNDQGAKDIAISHGGYDPASKWGFHGGDIQGLEEKLDYLQEMGITAIWMTPILRNKAIQGDSTGNHGYWIVDFTQIDPHFGSNDDLKSLIDAAHKRGMKIFFDIITNHTADVIKYKECHQPDGSFLPGKTECEFKSSEQLAAGDRYTPFIPEGEENVKVPAWLNDPKYYNNQGDSFWQGESSINGDFVGLDDLKTSDPDVVSGFIDIYKNIISEFKPDGFRIDTVKHVDLSFWQTFGPQIVKHAKAEGIPNFHIFGEVYSADPQVLSSFTTTGKLPSVLDFGFQDASAKVFYANGSSGHIRSLFDNDDYYNDADSQADLLMNFLGNHDMGRAGFFINQNLSAVADDEKLQRLILSHGFMYLSRGIPVVYYGDEQGFTGDGGDVDAREDMFPSKVDTYNDNNLLGTNSTTAEDNFNLEHPVYKAIRHFAQLRMNHKALRSGMSFNRFFDDNSSAFAIARVDKDEQKEYLVAFNPGNTPQTIELAASAKGYDYLAGSDSFDVKGDRLTIQLPALSYTLLRATDTLPVSALLELEFKGVEAIGEYRKFNFELPGAVTKVIPMFNVAVELKSELGAWIPISQDHTPPYSAVVPLDKLTSINPREIRVTVSNFSGQSRVSQIPLRSRAPQSVD